MSSGPDLFNSPAYPHLPRSIRVWELATGAARGAPLAGHDGPIRSVAVGQTDGVPVAVTGGHDGTVRIWNLTTGIPISVSPKHGLILAVATGRKEPVALSGNHDGDVSV